MFGLLTMLLSTLGATGMGSMLKIIAGIFTAISDAKATNAKRELARDLALSKASIEMQKAVFGEPNEKTYIFTRTTRRIIALIGMLNFSAISILCTLWPSVTIITFTPNAQSRNIEILWGLITIPRGDEVVSAITTGHISLVSIATLGAIVGFYFTPSAGGK